MQDTELVVTATLCLASGDFYISTDNSYVENNESFGVWPKHNLVVIGICNNSENR